MNRRSTTALIAMLLTLASGQALADSTRPLRLDFVAPPERPAAARAERAQIVHAQEPVRVATARATPMARAGDPPLRERALQSILDPPTPALANLEDNPAGGQLQLRFQKRGNAFRDLSKGYREMCDKASAKIWDDPNGKRIRFDVRGRPGIGVEIPIR